MDFTTFINCPENTCYNELECYTSEQRCDGHKDCSDGSDEEDCESSFPWKTVTPMICVGVAVFVVMMAIRVTYRRKWWCKKNKSNNGVCAAERGTCSNACASTRGNTHSQSGAQGTEKAPPPAAYQPGLNGYSDPVQQQQPGLNGYSNPGQPQDPPSYEQSTQYPKY